MRALSLFLILLTLLAVLGSTVGKYSPPGKPVSWICYTTGGGERESEGVREGKRGESHLLLYYKQANMSMHTYGCVCVLFYNE